MTYGHRRRTPGVRYATCIRCANAGDVRRTYAVRHVHMTYEFRRRTLDVRSMTYVKRTNADDVRHTCKVRHVRLTYECRRRTSYVRSTMCVILTKYVRRTPNVRSTTRTYDVRIWTTGVARTNSDVRQTHKCRRRTSHVQSTARTSNVQIPKTCVVHTKYDTYVWRTNTDDIRRTYKVRHTSDYVIRANASGVRKTYVRQAKYAWRTKCNVRVRESSAQI